MVALGDYGRETWVPKKGGKILTSRVTINFSKRNLLRGIISVVVSSSSKLHNFMYKLLSVSKCGDEDKMNFQQPE